jgi:hypothetical protein
MQITSIVGWRPPVAALEAVVSAREPRSVGRWLNGSPELTGLAAAAARLRALEAALAGHLDPSLRAHCRVARAEGDTLVLLADSPVWASRLRFAGPAILEALLPHLDSPPPTRVRVKVRPTASQEEPALPRPALSAVSARLIRQVADDLADPALGAALRRLSRRGG